MCSFRSLILFSSSISLFTPGLNNVHSSTSPESPSSQQSPNSSTNGNGNNHLSLSPGSNGSGHNMLPQINSNSKGDPANGGQQLRMPPPTSGGINEPQECPYCHRTFSCYYSLKRHFQDKHEQSDTLYVCEFCHRRYRTKNSLTTHKSLQHRGSSGMLKRLLKTTAIKSVLGPHPGVTASQLSGLSHHRASLFDFATELGQAPPGIQ